MSITTTYNYLDNGSQLHSSYTGNTFYGWDGYGWEITFPTAIPNVIEIDFNIAGVISNTTSQFTGQLRIRVYDESDSLIGSVNSSTVSKNGSISASSLSSITLTGETVSYIQILGPSNTGPNLNVLSTGSSTYNITTELSFEATTYTHLADLTWPEISGATEYTIRQIQDGSDEEDVLKTSLLLGTVELENSSLYVFNLYSDLDLINLHATLSVTPETVSDASVATLMTRIGNDMSIFENQTVLDEVESTFSNVLSTGDLVTLPSGLISTYVENSDTLTVETLNLTNPSRILTGFSTSGTNQEISVTLPDSTTATLIYDELLNEVNSVAVGSKLVLNGYVATVKEV